MSTRVDVLHEGALQEDLAIRLEHGTLTLPAGALMRMIALVHEPPVEGRGIAVAPPSIVIEYQVTIIADGIRLTTRMEIRKSDG